MNIEQANSNLESAARSIATAYDTAPVGLSGERYAEIVQALVAFHRAALEEDDDEIADALGMSMLEVWSVMKTPGMEEAMKRAEESVDDNE